MSSNNYISINFKTKRVEHRDADTDRVIGKSKDFKTTDEAVLKALELWNEWYPVEYGVAFEHAELLKKGRTNPHDKDSNGK